MTKKEKVKELSCRFTTNRDDWFSAFRHNMFILIDDGEITLRWISEEAGIPYSTLNSILYGTVKNPRIDVVIKIARALGITVDELIGAGTMSDGTRECVAICRTLPQHFVNLARAYIRHIFKLFKKTTSKEPRLVMLPECKNGHLQTTNITTEIDVSHLQRSTISRIAHCLLIPCDHYEPYYLKDEILLLGVDRDGMDGETCVIDHEGEYYIVKKKSFIENGVKRWKYMSLFTEKEILKEDVDDKLGYVIGYLNPDRTWGIR